jgi:hypothetical protein
MSWLDRLNKTAPAAQGNATKATKGPYVAFVAPSLPDAPEITQGAPAAPTLELFMQRGLARPDAQAVVDHLARRDRDLDDRKACIECSHLRGKRCSQVPRAGLNGHLCGAGFPMLLHRCPAFEPYVRRPL